MGVIRRAEEIDLLRLIEILRATYLGTMAAIVPPEALEAFHSEDGAGTFARACWQDFDVVVVDGVVAGLVFIVGNKLESLHIHPDFAGRGHGTSLLAHAEALIAKSHDTAELEVLQGNLRAAAFYVRHGWRKVEAFEGIEIADVTAPMFRMEKHLR